jgi:S1-C subfamily serine protease
MWIAIASGQGRGEAVEVGDEPVTIGSGESCALVVPDADVAPLHASVRREADGSLSVTALQDVRLDGRPVEGRTPLRDGARLQLADVELLVSERRPELLDDAAARHRQLDAAAEEVESPAEVEPVRGMRRGVRVATALGAAALAAAVVIGVLAVTDDDSEAGVDTAALVEEARPGTVRVEVSGPRGGGAGTGWVLDARRGLVVTNFHVVNGAKGFRVFAESGSAPADVLAAAPCDDVALLRIDAPRGLRALPLGRQSDVRPGDGVVALGYPANAGGTRELTSTAGVVSVTSAPVRSPAPDSPSLPNMLQTDAALNPGNSGGPLLDAEGRLVGMNTAVLTAQRGIPIQGQGYAIGVDRLRELLPALRRGESRGWPGFAIVVPDRRFLERRDLPDGLIAGAALPGTSAADAGLDRGEVLLVSIDGTRLRADMPSYCDAVEDLGGPAEVALIDRPGGRPRTVSLDFR